MRQVESFMDHIQIVRDPEDILGNRSRLWLHGVSLPLGIEKSGGAIRSICTPQVSGCESSWKINLKVQDFIAKLQTMGCTT